MTTHVLAPLVRTARLAPATPLITWVDHRGRDVSTLTARTALQDFAAVADGLRARGIAPGDRALLVHPPGLSFVGAFGGCLLAGVLPVPVYPPQPGVELDQRRLEALARAAGATIALTSTRFRWLQRASEGWLRLRGSQGARGLRWWATDGLGPGAAPTTVPHADPDDPAFLQFTSGSTASPKGVILTHGNLEHQLRMTRDHLRLGPTARVVAWVPQYHDLGLISGILSCLWRAGPLWLMAPTTFLRDPGVWMDVVHRVRATHTAAPNFAWDQLVQRTSRARRAPWDLSCLDVAMTAAEPVVPDTLRRTARALAPHGFRPSALCPAYGLAEHTVGVTLWGRGALRVDRKQLETEGRAVADGSGDLELAGCGTPPADVALRIVRDGQAVGPDEVGEIWVRSPSMAAGYWQRPDLTQRAFGGELEGRRWLRTGDLGFLHDGQLFVSGRIKDIVLVRGRNIAAEELEEALRGVDPRVRPTGVAAFALPSPDGERVGVLVEIDDPTADAADVARVVAARCQATWAVPSTIVVAPPRSVQKTTSGKVRRRSTRAALEAGEVRVLHRVDVGDPPRRAASRTAVTVVGAGLAGLVVADALAREGRRVVVLEANERPGGQLRTLPAGELGAMAFGARWTALLALADGLGLGIRRRLYAVGAVRGRAVDRVDLGDAVTWASRAVAAADGDPEDLDRVGAATWCANAGLAPFPLSFQAFWAFHGYGGETDSVSAAALVAYARLLDPEPRLWQVSSGNDAIARALVDRIREHGGVVRTRDPVTRVDGPIATTGSGPVAADHLVLAVPPAAAGALLGEHDPRVPLLRRYQTHDYRTSVVTVTGLPRLPRCVIAPDAFHGPPGPPLGLFRRTHAADDWTVYQLGSDAAGVRRSDAALDTARDRFVQSLGGTAVVVHGTARWSHFPHLDPADGGTHAELAAQQGADATWLSGGWWGASTAEHAVVHGQALAAELLALG